VNEIKRIGVRGIGPFRQAVFDIPKGITYLYGKNMLRRDGNGNAAGKSALVSSVAELFYDPMVGTKQDKVKTGARFVEFVKDGKLVKIGSSFKGKAEKLTVTVDGEDQSGRINKNTKEAIDKYWCLSEVEYKTYGYIDSSVPHPLARGSTLERKAFFTEFFGLDKLDAERKLVNAELLKLKRVRSAHQELDRTFQEVKKDMLSKRQRIDLEAELAPMIRKINKLKSVSDHYQRVNQLLEFSKFAGPQIKQLERLVPNLEDFDDAYAKVKKDRARASAAEEQLSEYKQYQRDVERYKAATQDLDMETPIKELRERSSAYLRAVADSENDLDEPTKVKKPKAPESDRKQVVAKAVNLEHQLEHATKFKTGVCGTCGQKVPVLSVPKLRAELEEAEAQVEEWSLYDRALKSYERSVEAAVAYQAAEAKAAEAKDKAAKLKKYHDLYAKRKDLQKPELVSKPELVDTDGLDEKFQLLKFCQPHIDTISDLAKLSKEDRELNFDSTELGTLQERASRIQAKIEVHNTVKARASKMKARLDSLADELADEKPLELLQSGYSDKAVKKMVIESISQHLMSTVNHYASIVFDDYRFEFVWGSQIQLLVHRPKIGTTDVRKLSGAESKLFTLILVLSLLKFVPKRKRLSLLVLDEPTASFSEETTELFHRLLPHLNQLIPSILVITPKSNERLESAKEFTVYRDRSGATIREGHPSSM
jgi:DNA repair exonuclease SbcCD ATPase subunit